MPGVEFEKGTDEGGYVKLGNKIGTLNKLGNALDEQELEPNVVAQGAGVDWGFGVGVTDVLFIVDVKSEHGDGLFDARETGSPVDARVDKHLIKRFIMAESLWPETIVLCGFVIETGDEDGVGVGAKLCDLFNNTSNKLLFNSVRGSLEVGVENVFGLEGITGVVFSFVWKSENDVFNGAGKEVGCVDNNCLSKCLIKFGL